MTPLPDGYTAVDLTAEHRRDVLTMDTWAFPDTIDPDAADQWPLPLVWERARGVRLGGPDGELVAMHASYPYRELPVPGGLVAGSGLTWVGVHPGHRRRGLLTAMIDEHLARSLARGEAVSALYAAEMAIYGRFGYGLAAHSVRLTVPRGARLREVPGAGGVRVRLESVDPQQHQDLVARLHDAVTRPGWARRASAEQRAAFLHDPVQWRKGGEPLRIAIAERGGEPLGYALFRRTMDWHSSGARGVVRLREVVAEDPAAARALWGVLLDLDLMATVEVGNLPVDDPLLHLLEDPRAAEPQLRDDVFVRLLDLPAALSARRYQTPVDVVLEVTDRQLPANAGRWRLTGGPEGGALERTDRAADLALDVRELGAVYLGGVSLTGLAQAGQVTELSPGSAHAAGVAFGWPVAPVSSWVW